MGNGSFKDEGGRRRRKTKEEDEGGRRRRKTKEEDDSARLPKTRGQSVCLAN